MAGRFSKSSLVKERAGRGPACCAEAIDKNPQTSSPSAPTRRAVAGLELLFSTLLIRSLTVLRLFDSGASWRAAYFMAGRVPMGRGCAWGLGWPFGLAAEPLPAAVLRPEPRSINSRN